MTIIESNLFSSDEKLSIMSILEDTKFQCCGENTTKISETERKCNKCNSVWLKKESGWMKKTEKTKDTFFGKNKD